MRRFILILVGFACLYAAAALSDTARNIVPVNCKDKQRLQLLSSGDPIEGDSSKVTCSVNYWACGQHFTQTQIAPNMPGACEAFTKSVRSKVGGEACCDCFPKCTATDSARRKPQAPAAEVESAPAVKGENVAQLQEQVKQLEARLKTLEEKLSGDEVTINAGSSTIRLKSDKTGTGIIITSDQEISIGSGRDISISSGKNVSIKATGNLVFKGTKILQN